MGWGPSAPDTSGMNQAAVTNAQIGQEQLGLARQQYADAKERQAQFDPKFAAIIDQSIASQKTQDDRSQQQWDNYTSTFMPAEKKLADIALNYDTPGRRAEAGAEARASVANEQALQQDAQKRDLSRSGVVLGGGNQLARDNAMRLAATKLSTGADAAAQKQVENTGLSLLDNTVKTGRGIASTSLQAAGLGVNAGAAGAGELGQQQATNNASLAPSLGLYQGAANASTQSGNIYGNIAQIQNQSQTGGLAGLAGLGQAAGMIYGSGMFQSSKKLKKPVGKKGRGLADAKRGGSKASATPAADAVSDSTPDRAWQYKQGVGMGDATHIGPYAEDVQREMGDGVAPGGEMIDTDRMAKTNAQAISELARLASRLEQRLGITA